jgi:Tol biopolymer transport system component/DNA-binding winged helix-turn-helix (wHTH) protein
MNQSPRHLYEFGPFRLDRQERLLLRDGATISLTPKAFDLLLALVERHGRLVEKEELFQTVWPDTIVEESNLTYNISHIRKALGDGENGLKFIETVPKRGYRFVAEVRRLPGEANELAPDATLPINEAPVVAVQPRRRFHPLLLVLLAPGLLIVGYYAKARWFGSREPSVAPMTTAVPFTTVPFTTLPGNENYPTFSPDGNSIAFTWDGEQGDNADIWVKQIGNESMHRLTTDPAVELWPRWSPDGRWIAFIRPGGLYLIPSLGGAERKITQLDSTSGILRQMPNWTPDSEWLAVSDRSSPAEPFGIWLVARETGVRRKLTKPPAVTDLDRSPAISPDGETVVFTRNSGGVDRLYLVPIAGAEPRRFSSVEGILGASPTWSLDGRAILFQLLHNNLWKAPVTGGTPERILTGLRHPDGFALSRQGNRLAWVQDVRDTNIWRMELDRGAKPQASPQPFITSTRMDVDMRFSPDGSKIAFASNRSESWEIWVCGSDGQRLVRLTWFNRFCGSPRWSPDGRQIVFDANVEDGAGIYVISVEGGKSSRLTNGPSREAVPSWSRDGNWIYFCSNRSGSNQIWKMPAAGGAAIQVTQQGGFESHESPDGEFLYFTKGYLPGIWRIPISGGEEKMAFNYHGAGKWRYWAVREQGIYFATAEIPERPQLEFFNFATRKVTTIAKLGKKIGVFGFNGLDVSPDGRWLIWQQLDQEGSDIMLMENFR